MVVLKNFGDQQCFGRKTLFDPKNFVDKNLFEPQKNVITFFLTNNVVAAMTCYLLSYNAVYCNNPNSTTTQPQL